MWNLFFLAQWIHSVPRRLPKQEFLVLTNEGHRGGYRSSYSETAQVKTDAESHYLTSTFKYQFKTTVHTPCRSNTDWDETTKLNYKQLLVTILIINSSFIKFQIIFVGSSSCVWGFDPFLCHTWWQPEYIWVWHGWLDKTSTFNASPTV